MVVKDGDVKYRDGGVGEEGGGGFLFGRVLFLIGMDRGWEWWIRGLFLRGGCGIGIDGGWGMGGVC